MLQKLKRIDLIILLILICFMIISTLAIYSATLGTKYAGLPKTHLSMFILFLMIIPVMVIIDYRLYLQFAHIIYVIGIALLIWVMVDGVDLNGSTRWINIAGMQFQPSELVKMSTILLLAKLLSKREGAPLQLKKDLLPLAFVILIPFAFVLKQPDLGTAIVFFCIFVGMILIGNIRLTHLLIGVGIILVLLGVFLYLYYFQFDIFDDLLEDHQIKRINSFMDILNGGSGDWHVQNSITAVGMGQLAGLGFTEGIYVQRGFIPYDYADSIYVVIGEEFGFLGSVVLIMLYFLLLYRMSRIAIECTDRAGAYIIVGIISMLTIQVFENIAMHIGLMPLTGIALPFISYGGSSLLTHIIAIGIVLSIRSHQIEVRDSIFL